MRPSVSYGSRLLGSSIIYKQTHRDEMPNRTSNYDAFSGEGALPTQAKIDQHRQGPHATKRVYFHSFLLLFLALLPALTFAETRSVTYTTQLRQECDALIQSAVRRPYGWGWDPALRGGDLKRPTIGRPVSMEPLGSPAAALVLLWAGDLLDQPAYISAANEVGHGIEKSLAPAGKVPAFPVFSGTAGGREPASYIADRASTVASLACLLMLQDRAAVADDKSKGADERLTRATRRVSVWLMQQQTDIGGWPSAYPPDAPPASAIRVLRLDSADYRNCSLALLLAGAIDPDPQLLRSNEKMLSHLLLLRQDTPGDPANHLWYTAYKPNGAAAPDLVHAANGADLLASRYAMQVLLGSYLLNGDRSIGLSLDASALAIEALRKVDEQWDRFPSHPEAAPPILGGTNVGTQGLPGLLSATAKLRTIGRARYLELLAAQFTPRQAIAAMLCGLSDNPFSLNLPITSSEAEGYLKQHEADPILTSPLPEQLAPRVQRLWQLLLCAKAEKLMNP